MFVERGANTKTVTSYEIFVTHCFKSPDTQIKTHKIEFNKDYTYSLLIKYRRKLTMKFFIDTANFDEIKEAYSWGILSGVTTNPSLVA